jgi:gamma-glutamylcyclotransferase (GGCT)/AIG2-like uncharacterized protein YtfP
MNATLYFAYGANLDLRGIKRRCPKATPVIAASLSGYRLEFRRFATIVAEPRAEVSGALYMLTRNCWHALDAYEGPEYDKIKVTVDTFEGPREAMAYAMRHGERAPPSLAYFSTIARGYRDWKLDANALRRARLATLHPVKLQKTAIMPTSR